MSEPAEQTIARLTRERDEMATQASACAEEVDRVRVEIERLKAELAGSQEVARIALAQYRLVLKDFDKTEAALAESERKMADVMRAFGLALAFADRAAGEGLVFGATSKQPEIDAVDVCLLAEEVLGFGYEDARWAALITPTQETPHVES